MTSSIPIARVAVIEKSIISNERLRALRKLHPGTRTAKKAQIASSARAREKSRSERREVMCRGAAQYHAEKLSPHEQCATAFGFVTLKPPFCKSSLKSSSEPLTKSAL